MCASGKLPHKVKCEQWSYLSPRYRHWNAWCKIYFFSKTNHNFISWWPQIFFKIIILRKKHIFFLPETGQRQISFDKEETKDLANLRAKLTNIYDPNLKHLFQIIRWEEKLIILCYNIKLYYIRHLFFKCSLALFYTILYVLYNRNTCKLVCGASFKALQPFITANGSIRCALELVF